LKGNGGFEGQGLDDCRKCMVSCFRDEYGICEVRGWRVGDPEVVVGGAEDREFEDLAYTALLLFLP
jgi:hypothetical protein